MIVRCLLSTTADCCVVARVVNHVAATRADRGEIANVQRTVVTLDSTHVAVNRLLSCMVPTSMMEPSLVELVGSNLTKSILVLSSTSAEIATVALMNWVTRTSGGSLLSQFSLCYCL